MEEKRTLWHQPELDNPAYPSNRGESFKNAWGGGGCSDPDCCPPYTANTFVRPDRTLVGIQGDTTEDANLVSSFTNKGNHMPVLDIDLPCELRPSKTPGHFHLLIDKSLSWDQYAQLLRALMYAGIIEDGYYRAAMAAQATYIRANPESRPARDTEPTEAEKERARRYAGSVGYDPRFF